MLHVLALELPQLSIQTDPLFAKEPYLTNEPFAVSTRSPKGTSLNLDLHGLSFETSI